MTGYAVELKKKYIGQQNVAGFGLDMQFHISLQSYVHLVFRDEKDPRTECEHWQYWHSQQPNPQQRAFDIGRLDHFTVILVA